jgi:hypothetical protein
MDDFKVMSQILAPGINCLFSIVSVVEKENMLVCEWYFVNTKKWDHEDYAIYKGSFTYDKEIFGSNASAVFNMLLENTRAEILNNIVIPTITSNWIYWMYDICEFKLLEVDKSAMVLCSNIYPSAIKKIKDDTKSDSLKEYLGKVESVKYEHAKELK